MGYDEIINKAYQLLDELPEEIQDKPWDIYRDENGQLFFIGRGMTDYKLKKEKMVGKFDNKVFTIKLGGE